MSGMGTLATCRITIEKSGKSGPVAAFLTDSDTYYRAVYDHLKGCPTCDPSVVLRAILERRETVQKFRGATSSGLIDLAMRYRKRWPDKVPEDLVRRFVVRGLSPAFDLGDKCVRIHFGFGSSWISGCGLLRGDDVVDAFLIAWGALAEKVPGTYEIAGPFLDAISRRAEAPRGTWAPPWQLRALVEMARMCRGRAVPPRDDLVRAALMMEVHGS